MNNKFSKFIVAILGCELVGLAGTPFTISAIPTWYTTLNKPSFSPPNGLFGPVWTTLYALMGIALVLGWKSKLGLKYFWVQLALNLLWSLLFFGLHSPILAMADILLLLLFIILTIYHFHKVSKLAAYLLIPYLVWVSFATVLNFSIVVLNP